MIKSTKRGSNFAQFTLLSIGAVLIKNTFGPLGVKVHSFGENTNKRAMVHNKKIVAMITKRMLNPQKNKNKNSFKSSGNKPLRYENLI
jgi:hypothetical protein